MKTLFLKLWAWVTGSSVKLYQFLAPILASNTAELLTVLSPIALDIVQSLATSGKSGAEKRAAAFEQIEVAAIAQGIKASASVINTAIELSVQNLQATKQLSTP